MIQIILHERSRPLFLDNKSRFMVLDDFCQCLSILMLWEECEMHPKIGHEPALC
jgi:hypothetical protein